MIKKIVFISLVTAIFCIAALHLTPKEMGRNVQIRRLTYSGNDIVHYPCLSADGKRMMYVLESQDGEEVTKSVRIMNIETGSEKELFRDRTRLAPEPFPETHLLVGSKPPALSGNGCIAAFSLSLDHPSHIIDHYLAVMNTDGTDLKIISFPIAALAGKNSEKLDFETDEWERISHYAMSRDGRRISCAVKGHLGPIRYGNASGIIFLDTSDNTQRTILAPDFDNDEWVWSSPPYRPLTGGGWAFDCSPSGDMVLFGAQSSHEKTDYDLYITDWEGREKKRITDFHDRWFSLAELDSSGNKAIFLYNGKKKRGIGTYTIKTDGSELRYLRSQIAPRIEYVDMSANGRYILFKHIYKGIFMDLQTDREGVAFDEHTSGYVQSLIPMDFPRYPSFWSPGIMSAEGKSVLLFGFPQDKDTPEVYFLSFETNK